MKEQSKKTDNKNIMKAIKIITIILFIVLITVISFFGIYKQNKNKVANTVKDYTYSMSINGARTIKLQLDTGKKEIIKDSEGKIIESATDEEIEKNGYVKEEVPNNAEEAKTLDNYKKVKNIIEKRLNYLGVQEYNISLNEETGELIVEIPENLGTDTVVSNLIKTGKFEIIDSETKEVLLDNSNIKSSDVLYNTTENGTGVYLDITFNKEGKAKLEEISKTYVKVEEKEENNTVEDSNVIADTNVVEDGNVVSEDVNTITEENAANEKKITMKIDDEEIMSTSFEDPITTGSIQLSVGTASTDSGTIEDYIKQAQSVAVALDNGNMPLKYTVGSNEYILSDIIENDLKIVAIIISIIVLVGIIILIAKYKTNGLIAGFSYIGLTALYLLLIRYANVMISIESICAILIILVLNYIFTQMLLNRIDEKSKEKNTKSVDKKVLETYVKFFNRLIPVCIITIAFCFVKWIPLSSFGMTLFWGIIIIAVYNAVVTRMLLKIKMEDK